MASARPLLPAAFFLSFAAALMPFVAYEAHGFLAAFLLLAIAVFYVAAAAPKSGAVGADGVMILGGAFWLLALISAAMSEMPTVSFVFFCFFSALPLSFLLTVLVPDKENFFRRTGILLAGLFAALSVFTLAQYFFLPGWLHKGLAHWPLADPNSFAGMYSLAFFCALGLMLAARSRAQSNAGLLLALLFLTTIFMTGSKGAFLALGMAVVPFLFLVRGRLKLHLRCLLILAFFSMIIFAALGLYKSAPSVKAPLSAFTGGAGAVESHMPLWRAAWRIGQEHLFTGTGVGTFFIYYPAYRTETYTAGFMAHSDPLQFFAEMGMGAPLLFYAFIFIVLAAAWQKIAALTPGDERRVHILAPLCALGAMAAHAHINFPFNVLPLLMLSGLLLGYLYQRLGGAFFTLRGVGPVAGAQNGLALGCLLLILPFFMLQGSEILTLRAQAALERGDSAAFAADLNTAGRLSMGYNPRALVLAAGVPMGILETNRVLPPEEKEKLAKKAEGLIDKAENLNPRSPAPYYFRAQLMQAAVEYLRHTEHSPEELLRQALTVDPLHMPSRMMLADLLTAAGLGKEGLAVLKEGMRWPNAGIAFLQKTAALAAVQGDSVTHKAAMQRIAELQRRTLQKASGDGLRGDSDE